MEVFSMGSRKRETYNVEVKYSLMWETAMGIAAVTNERLLDTLEYTKEQWQEIKDSLEGEMLDQLEIVKQHNTWKTILLLLHERDVQSVDEFNEFVDGLSEERLRWIAIPYLGERHEEDRKQASRGDEEAVQRLKEGSKENVFFPDYIAYIFKVDAGHLKHHVKQVMRGWYESVLRPDEKKLTGLLHRDAASKEKRLSQLDAEAFVEWATGGIRYHPEPSVHKVIMIPQFIYRPWNIEAEIKGAKVFYYPVSNESIYPTDPFVPDQTLVQKFKALGDENRLRILKILMSGSRTLKEVTEEVDMGKTTVHHHLKLLKSARLLVTDGSRYVVNPEGRAKLLDELEWFLGEKP